jgi:hypothetical protein
MFRDEDIETLMRLGLTLLQAKTYLTLSTMGSATMGIISKASSIARQDVYRVMPTLQKLGLVEKVIKTPATYQALPIKDGLSILLQQRKENYTALQKKALKLLGNRQEPKKATAIREEEDTQFAIIYDKTLLFQKFWKGNQTAQKSIDCSGLWQDIKILLSNCNGRDDHFTEANKKGVRVRIVTEEHKDDTSIDRILAVMCKNPLFDIRFLSAPMPVKIVLYDGKEAHTSISTSADTDMPSLWSNNPNFVRIMTNQFEDMWNRGSTFAPKTPQKLEKVSAQKTVR